MIQLHCGVKQLKIGKHMGVLILSAWNYVKYANMEGFRRDSRIYVWALWYTSTVGQIIVLWQASLTALKQELILLCRKALDELALLMICLTCSSHVRRSSTCSPMYYVFI